MRERWPTLALIAVVLALAYALYHEVANRPQPGGPAVAVAPAPAVRNAPTARVQVRAPVTAYRGDAPARLRLPADVTANPDREVIAAAQVKPDPRPQTVSTVIDTRTGAVQNYVTVDPYPWLAVEARGEARLHYGYKNAGLYGVSQVVRAQVSYEVVRVKALTLGVTATLDSDGDAFAGVGVTYRW